MKPRSTARAGRESPNVRPRGRHARPHRRRASIASSLEGKAESGSTCQGTVPSSERSQRRGTRTCPEIVAGLAPTVVTVRADRKGAAARRQCLAAPSLGVPSLGCNMLPHTGTANGAADQSGRRTPFTQSAAEVVRPLGEHLPHTGPGTAPAPVDLDPRPNEQTAAAGGTPTRGIGRDGGGWVTECAWCKQVRTVTGEWQTQTPAARAATGTERTHGVCPQCARGLMERAEREAPSAR